MKKYEKIIIALIISAVILGYGYMNNKAKDKRIIQNQSNILNCKQSCYHNYTLNWNSACRSVKKKHQCDLVSTTAEGIEHNRDFCISNCIKIFGN